MRKSAIAMKIFLLGSLPLGANTVLSQDFPSKPVRIVTTEAGGGSDFAARLIGQELSATLGQQVIVDNRPGTVLPVEAVAKAAPDGYTLLILNNVIWLGQFLQSVPFDASRDFAPITLALKSPNLIVVHPSVPVSSVPELIALAKSKPGALNYGSTGIGSSSHLSAELFKAMAKVDIVRVPYKGTAPALNDLIGGQTQVMFPPAAAVTPHVKAGRVRALAVTSATASPLAPGLPAAAASGLPGYESISIYAVFAPAKTPNAIIALFNKEIVRILNKEDVKERFFNTGVEAVGSSADDLSATIRKEMAVMSKVIKDAGIRAD